MDTHNHPWTALYPSHVDHGLTSALKADTTLAAAWRRRVTEDPQGPVLRYFELTLNAAEVDELSDALAVFFEEQGVRRLDRVGIQLQNIPQFALCLLALWKIGAVPLILNTMYGPHELSTILRDARPAGVISAELSEAEICEIAGAENPLWTLSTDDEDLLAHITPTSSERHASGKGLVAQLAAHRGSAPNPVSLAGDDPALLTYTSGTTGPAKGAVGTHTNLLAVGAGVRQWLDLRPGDGVLAVAPLFHITGAVATAATTLTLSRSVLVFVGRVRPESILTALRDHEVNHILGSITVYNAVLDSAELRREDLAGLKTVYSGGAPVPPATVASFEERFGHYIHNVYGMTETASAVIGVPLGTPAPVDPESGALAIGVPLPGMEARIVGMDGGDAGFGVMGELALRGPQCTTEYLNKPEATAEAIREGWLHTGDVAVMDEQGWVYLVDRQKDQINVSGYKVWPREVEDVIYEHPAVREVAVVGLPDDYSGERVVAFVALQAGQHAETDELHALVRGRLAAFKVPKEVIIIDDLPKTPTGKIQRRVLRSGAA